MERRLLLAIALMIGVMILSNLLFPPVPRPPAAPGADSVPELAETPARPSPDSVAAATPADTVTPAVGVPVAPAPAAAGAAPARGEIVTVRSPLYEYRFDTRGARLVGARMLRYENLAEGAEPGERVELVREGDDVLGYRIAVAPDTVSLDRFVFTASATDLDVTGGPAELSFSTRLGDSPLRFEVTYRFVPDDYRIDVRGRLEGLGERGHTVLMALGRGLATNEANEREDLGQIALVTRDRTGSIQSTRLDRVDDGTVETVSGAAFSWAASKSKYFLAALVSDEGGPGFGGVIVRGTPEPNGAEMEVALPVPVGRDGFEFILYAGPQDFERLSAIGQSLNNVNPFGWRILQWFIRPFGALVIAVLVWMHEAFSLAYGWVLILFGILTRILLFPLYQKSMRTQMRQMALQPEIKRIQERYKEDPPRLQQEMMKVYREHGVNPLGGCLPMLLPFPILITLFFVFQNTIEFRGVPFLWLPDLSLKDPLYMVPLLMGGSMLLLNWIGQRGLETNPQMKMFTYVLPVVFTFMFAQFAAGLNLYYAASNIASLPQQMYLSKERRRARVTTEATKPEEPGEAGAAEGRKGASRKAPRTRSASKRSGLRRS